MGEDELEGTGRIQVSTAPRVVHLLRRGDFIEYVPRELTEQDNMIPRLAQVQKIERHGGRFTITTSLGVMVVGEGGKVRVVV